MQIDIERLVADGEEFEGEEPPAILALDKDEFYRAHAPIRYDLRAQLISDELIVTGRLDTEVEFWCSRCGQLTPMKIEEPAFERTYDLTSEDVPRAPDHPESVDLTPDIREATILTFHAYPVCQAECRGLCSICGTNLNTGSCDCIPPQDLRWDALDQVELG